MTDPFRQLLGRIRSIATVSTLCLGALLAIWFVVPGAQTATAASERCTCRGAATFASDSATTSPAAPA